MYQDKENDWYAKYHELPGEGEPFSAFDWGNVHVVAISIDDTAKAPAWLDQHLPTVNAPWVLVVQHLPVYCTGYDSPRTAARNPAKASRNWPKSSTSTTSA